MVTIDAGRPTAAVAGERARPSPGRIRTDGARPPAGPDADTRLVIADIEQMNPMTGDQLQPGETLWVPRG